MSGIFFHPPFSSSSVRRIHTVPNAFAFSRMARLYWILRLRLRMTFLIPKHYLPILPTAYSLLPTAYFLLPTTKKKTRRASAASLKHSLNSVTN